MRRPARLPGASAAGAVVPRVSDITHADNVVLEAAAAKHVPVAGHGIVAEVAVVLEQPDVLAEQQLELGLSKVREAEASRAALGGVGSSETNVMDRHNHNIGRAAILLLVLVLYHPSYWSLSSELLLLHYRLLLNRSGPNPLMLMHGLYSLKSLLCPVSSPHSILVGGMLHTSHMQLNVVP